MHFTHQQRVTLQAAIAAATELADAVVAGDDVSVSAWLNEPVATMPRERFVTARTVLAEIGPAGAVLLDKLEAFAHGAPPADPVVAAMHSATRWGVRFLTTDGIDIGHSTTRALVAGLATAKVIDEAERDALLGLALQPASRAATLLDDATVRTLSASDVAAILRG